MPDRGLPLSVTNHMKVRRREKAGRRRRIAFHQIPHSVEFQVPEDIAYLDALPALTRTHPL
jgi:hypothetical protein